MELCVLNRSLYDNVYKVKTVSVKTLRIDIAILKEIFRSGKLKICCMDSKAQSSDVLTK